jgi:glutaredoxin
MKMTIVKVSGNNRKHKVLVYALSSCGWCKLTKKFLKENDIAFEYIDVDLISIEEVRKIKQDILNRGEIISYPKIIVDDEIMISGFQEEKLRRILEI